MEPTFIKFTGRFIDVDDKNRSISPLGLWSVGALAKVADVPLDAHFPRINKSQSSVYNKLRRLADSSLEEMSWVHGA